MDREYNISTEEFIDIAGKGIVDRSDNKRHEAIRRYDLSLNKDFPEKIKKMREGDDREEDTCVVYSLWDNFAYVKYAYLSILSNYLYTDLEDFKLRVIIGGDLNKYKQYLIPIFNDLGAKVHSVEEPCFKYKLPRVFSDYDVVFGVDADVFFGGSKLPVYSLLRDRYKKLKEDSFIKTPYIGCKEQDYRTEKRFFYPDEVLDDVYFGKDKKDFVTYWVNKEFLDLSPKKVVSMMKERWLWNTFSVFSPDLFESKKWKALEKFCNDMRLWDDEFVYTLYFWDNDIPLNFIENFNRIRVGENAVVPEEDNVKELLLSHPINSYDKLDNKSIVDFFNRIEKKFESL